MAGDPPSFLYGRWSLIIHNGNLPRRSHFELSGMSGMSYMGQLRFHEAVGSFEITFLVSKDYASADNMSEATFACVITRWLIIPKKNNRRYSLVVQIHAYSASVTW